MNIQVVAQTRSIDSPMAKFDCPYVDNPNTVLSWTVLRAPTETESLSRLPVLAQAGLLFPLSDSWNAALRF